MYDCLTGKQQTLKSKHQVVLVDNTGEECQYAEMASPLKVYTCAGAAVGEGSRIGKSSGHLVGIWRHGNEYIAQASNLVVNGMQFNGHDLGVKWMAYDTIGAVSEFKFLDQNMAKEEKTEII